MPVFSRRYALCFDKPAGKSSGEAANISIDRKKEAVRHFRPNGIPVKKADRIKRETLKSFIHDGAMF